MNTSTQAQAKHTSGPWEIGERSSEDNSLSVKSRKQWVASVDPRPFYNPGEQEANAWLIASSPEMLVALEDAEFIMRKLAANPSQIMAMLDSLLRSASDAREIISKAKGVQS